MPQLNDLSLDELTELGKTIALLVVTGGQFERSGFTPTFDLTPGAPTRIILPPMMPKISEPSPVETFLANRAEYLNREMAERFPPSTEAAPIPPGGAVAPFLPEPVDLPPADEGPAGGNPIPSAPEQSVAGVPEIVTPVSAPQDDPLPVTRAAEGSGGGQGNGSGSTPPAATHERTFGGAAVWTPEEDARLVDLVASGMVRMGLGKTAAIRAAAAELARPEQGTAFRCHHKLKARIDAAISALAMDQAQTEIPDVAPPAPIGDEPDVEPGQREAETAVRAAGSIDGQLADAADLDAKSRAAAIAHGNGPEVDALQKHIDATRINKDGWTLQRDFDLLDLAIVGWQVNEISLEIGVMAKLIKPRLDVLTGLHTDEATGKQVRRFKREAVRDALQARLTATGKAA